MAVAVAFAWVNQSRWEVLAGGEYSSLMLGARVDTARVPELDVRDGAHSRPAFQLLVLPTVV
jgi:hypothetical protein